MAQYDSIAEEYHKACQYGEPSRQIIHDKLKKYNLNGKTILDLGCGTGIDLSQYEDAAVLIGVDESNKMLQIAKKNVSQARFIQTHMKATTLQANSVDIVISRYAMQHHNNLEEIFKEIHRILKPGGKALLLLTHPLRNYIESDNKNYFEQKDNTSKIINSSVTISEPNHTISQHITKFVWNNFNLIENLKESVDAEAPKTELDNYPHTIFYHLAKK